MKVCLISEGGYPVVRGGLGQWAHSLVSSLNQVDYAVFAVAGASDRAVWERLPNVSSTTVIPFTKIKYPRTAVPGGKKSVNLARFLREILKSQPMDLSLVVDGKNRTPIDKQWLFGRDYWHSIVITYEEFYRNRSFTEYFWTILGLHSTIIDCLNALFFYPARTSTIP